jgi:protein-disulfide isomerase
MKEMRFIVLSLFATLLVAQTPPAAQKKAPAASAMAAPAHNYKLSGSPTAPVTLELYTDFECPSCRMFFMQVLPDVKKNYVDTGKIQLLHRDYELPQHQFTKVATRYANAAGKLGQTQYDLVTQQIFQTQQEWSQNGNVDGQVAKVLSPADMAKVRDMVKNDSHLDDTVQADYKIATADGLNQTPTLVIVANGRRQRIDGALPYPVLKSYLDSMIAKK